MKPFTVGAAIGLAVFAVQMPSIAMAAPQCPVRWSALHDKLDRLGWAVVELPAGERRAFVRDFNDTPPRTHLDAARVFLAATKDDANTASGGAADVTVSAFLVNRSGCAVGVVRPLTADGTGETARPNKISTF
jgi:hypothetical protein